MDFMNKSFRPSQPRDETSDQPQISNIQNQDFKKPKQKFPTDKWFNVANLTLLATITILIVAVAIFFGTSKDQNSSEFEKVEKTKLQAVFLDNGQVYFGKIAGLNDKTITLNSIYYLRSNQQDQSNQQDISNNLNADDLSLIKLGCEVHGPEDQMVINREQIVFWENLKNDGKVALTVKQYVKDNPNGKNCETVQQESSSQNPQNQSTEQPTTSSEQPQSSTSQQAPAPAAAPTTTTEQPAATTTPTPTP